MIVETIFPSGGWSIYAMVGERLVSWRYFGYSKTEAIANFREEVRRIKAAEKRKKK